MSSFLQSQKPFALLEFACNAATTKPPKNSSDDIWKHLHTPTAREKKKMLPLVQSWWCSVMWSFKGGWRRRWRNAAGSSSKCGAGGNNFATFWSIWLVGCCRNRCDINRAKLVLGHVSGRTLPVIGMGTFEEVFFNSVELFPKKFGMISKQVNSRNLDYFQKSIFSKVVQINYIRKANSLIRNFVIRWQ